MLKEKFSFVTIDCSDVLRKAADKDESIKADIAAGKLVSSQKVVNHLIAEMDNHNGQVYVISGFPKSQENLDVFN